MCPKIRCDGKSEKFCKIFWELNRPCYLCWFIETVGQKKAMCCTYYTTLHDSWSQRCWMHADTVHTAKHFTVLHDVQSATVFWIFRLTVVAWKYGWFVGEDAVLASIELWIYASNGVYIRAGSCFSRHTRFEATMYVYMHMYIWTVAHYYAIADMYLACSW
jgi:hypothetical protein